MKWVLSFACLLISWQVTVIVLLFIILYYILLFIQFLFINYLAYMLIELCSKWVNADSKCSDSDQDGNTNNWNIYCLKMVFPLQ